MTKVRIGRFVCAAWLLTAMTMHFPVQARQGPVYPIALKDQTQLTAEAAPFLAMSEAELLALVPPQSGFFFGGCPNCDGGAQDRSLYWDLSLGDKVRCRYCKMTFPNEQYPDNGNLEVETPSGGRQVFRYHEAKDGSRFWFEGRRWYEQKALLEKAAHSLAQLYRLNPAAHREAGRRAALIIERFAQVYPGYIVHFDYPGRNKEFRAGTGVKGYQELLDGPYRLARWDWWAYMDISQPLLRAWDQLSGSEIITPQLRQRVENDLFGSMVSFVDQYRHISFTNMHPIMWESQAVAARVLGRPQLADEVLSGLRTMVRTQFTADGFWIQPTVSYHLQTTSVLRQVLAALYPDKQGAGFETFLQREHPDLARALLASDAFRLPNGHYAALNDTWAFETYKPAIQESKPYLMPVLGYGVLGMGRGNGQLQAHLDFTGRHGHNHFGSLNLLLFGAGKELVSDIGYTHSIARPWTLSTAAHNTVVVDCKNQVIGADPEFARGRLLLFDTADPAFLAIEAEAPEAYTPEVKTYRRALVTVQVPGGTQYVADIFTVEGGSQHDWILHGSADEDQQLALTADARPLESRPVKTLLPEGFDFRTPATEDETDLVWNGPWAYGNFREVRLAGSDRMVLAAFGGNNGSAALQSWIAGAPGTTYLTARSWAVRGAHENEAKLNQHLRSSLIVRRPGPRNTFIAVHVPVKVTPGVTNVRQLPWTGGVALKIEHSLGSDYLIYQPVAGLQRGTLEGRPVEFDGRIGLIRWQDGRSTTKIIGGASLAYHD